MLHLVGTIFLFFFKPRRPADNIFINELKNAGMVIVHLDAEQAGVGTATCGPGVQPQYRVSAEIKTFYFLLQPEKTNQLLKLDE